MHKAALLILFTLICSPTYAKKEHNKPVVINLSDDVVKQFVVAKEASAHLSFPSAVLIDKEILVTYLRTDSIKQIMETRSLSNGQKWGESSIVSGSLSNGNRTLSMFKISRLRYNYKQYIRNSVFAFSGGIPLLVTTSLSGGNQWTEAYPVNNFGTYRISSLSQLKDGHMVAFFDDDGRFLFDQSDSLTLGKSNIYKITSSNAGVSWSKPEIALRHNIHGLYDAIICRLPKESDELMMICSERESSLAYISFSKNEGESWSYPVKLPKMIQGDRFSVDVVGKEIYLAFRDMCRFVDNNEINPTFGDLVLWKGDIKELMSGKKSGLKVRIGDNFPVKTTLDLNDRRVYDCGYPTILQLSRKRLAIIAYGRWDAEQHPYIVNFTVDTKRLSRYFRKRNFWIF